jgi:hypothetical protein
MTINPKAVYLFVGIWAGLLVGSVIGFKMGSLNSRQIVAQICANLQAADGGHSTNTVVNMMAALDQARQGAQRCGVAITNASIFKGHSIRLILTNGACILLNWSDMGEDTARSKSALDNKLRSISVVLKESARIHAPLGKIDMAE